MGRTNPTKVRRHVSGNLNFNVIWDPSLARRRKKSLNHLDDARPTRNRIIRPDFDKTRFSQSAGEDISINARFEPELNSFGQRFKRLFFCLALAENIKRNATRYPPVTVFFCGSFKFLLLTLILKRRNLNFGPT